MQSKHFLACLVKTLIKHISPATELFLQLHCLNSIELGVVSLVVMK